MSADPRIKLGGDGPHPNIAAVTALASSVQERLDAVGVPREVEAGTLTILGRLDALLERLAPVAVEVVGTDASGVNLRLGGQLHTLAVGDVLQVPAVVLT